MTPFWREINGEKFDNPRMVRYTREVERIRAQREQLSASLLLIM